MCMFSTYVPWVASTSIFARTTDRRTQRLAYSMSFAAVGELAMILPLPVPPGSGEDAARFIDFSRYPSLFDDLERAFADPRPPSRSRSLQSVPRPARLVVHDVGDFEASYVPTIADFVRLDERFRLPHGLWDRLPVYADYGFAVFKLKGAAASGAPGEAAKQQLHPMVLEFPTRSPDRTFFPTLHVHDEAVHPRATFDHALYVQGSPTASSTFGWRQSLGPALAFVDVAKTQGLVLGDELCYRREMRGAFANADVWV
jgi:hypothetical protein